MVVAQKSGDITNCAICLEILDIPKCLPCLHTFCEKCISSFIASSFEKGDTTQISCPVCRTFLSVPVKNCSPEDWAKRLPLNFLIVGLLEKQKIERVEKQCMSCERLDKSATAVFVCVECSDALCDNCYQYHKGNKFTSRHKTVSITDISEVEKSLNFFRSDCSEHTNEELKLFCVDHGVPCCSLCVSVTHRKCNEVVTLDQAAQGFVASDVAEQIEQTLTNIEKDTLLLIDHNRKCDERLTSQVETGGRNIDSYFDKLQTMMENAKLNLKDKLIKISNEKKDTIETNITMLDNMSKKVENEKKILTACLQKASPVQAMIETQKLETRQKLHTQTIAQAYENTCDYNLIFKVNKEIDNFEDNVSVSCEGGATLLGLETVPSMKLKLKWKINHGRYIKDCFCDVGKCSVVLDNNYYVTTYDVSGNRMFSVRPCYVNNGYLPAAIAEGDSGEVVVGYSNVANIDIMNQNGSLKHQISTSLQQLNSIAMHKGQQRLIVSNGKNIEIYRKSGGRTLALVSKGARYLWVNSQDRLYYAESTCVISKTLEGKEESKVEVDSGDINGLAVDPKGKIFVSSTQNNKVSLLLSTGSIRCNILTENDGLSRPSLVCCSFDGTMLLVVNNDNSKILCFEVL